MTTKKVREDNQKVHKLLYLLIALFAGTIAYINIMNTQQLIIMYSLFGASVLFVFFMMVYLIIKRKRNTVELSYEENQLLFYQSNYEKNKSLKLAMIILDVLSMISLAALTYYFYIKMDFVRVYDFYGLIILGVILLFLLFILIRDVVRLTQIDRVDASSSALSVFSYDKKFMLAFILLLIGAMNVGVLSFDVPHFTVIWMDLLILEIIGFITSCIYTYNLYITNKYYSYFTVKKIDEIALDTKILECIGKGLYASVYKVFIPSLDKILAIKKLESKEVNDIARFEAEFKLMKSMEHQNLIGVYSYNEVKLEYIMDYVDYSLYDYIKDNALDNKHRLELIKELLDGVEYLHNRNILHRDLSFGNVMIKRINEEEVKLKITDFGLSKNKFESIMTKTKTTAMGTIVDPTLSSFKEYKVQNDIYPLGVLINYIYYGTQAIVKNDDLISRIVFKCMDLDLKNRYKNVIEIKEEVSKGLGE